MKVDVFLGSFHFQRVRDISIQSFRCSFEFAKMSSVVDDEEIQELNCVFQSLGKRRKEGEKWKQHTETVLFFILQQLSELLDKNSDSRIMFQPTGSAAEDLKLVEPDDVGDVDIMIFPNSENLMIHDEMIEYLPENPRHVRIKGVDHPILQSCLVEGTEYVATSSLKNFHPAIYGESVSHIADLNTLAIQRLILSPGEFSSILHSTAQMRNNPNSPAITLNFSQPRQLEDANHLKEVPDICTAEWEGLVALLFREMGKTYTRDHAEELNSITELMNEIGTVCQRKGLNSPAEILPVLLEFYNSDRAKHLRDRMHNIESRDQNGNPRETEMAEDISGQKKEQNFHTPRFGDEYKSESSKENLLKDHCATSDNGETLSPKDFESVSHKSTVTCPSGNSDQFLPTKLCKAISESKGVDDKSEKRKKEDVTENEVNELNTEQRSKAGNEVEFTSDAPPRSRCRNGDKQEEKREFDRRTQNRFFDHLFGSISEAQKDSSKGTNSKDTQNPQRVGGFDFVPAFRASGWPEVAREWITRKRKWPSPSMVNRVTQEGFHLVVKSPKNGGKPDRDFRISFSHAEYLLSQEMNDIQRECYRCLKKFHRVYLSKDPKGLVSFHLKNILLQTIEETGADMWTDNNRVECMMKLLDTLLEALRKKDLRHFFVRSYNIFGANYIENPRILECLSEIAVQIRNNPVHFATPLIQNIDCKDKTAPKGKEGIQSSQEILPKNIVKTEERTRREATESPPRGRNDTQCKQKESVRQERNSFGTSFRHHDMKDNYLSISKELTAMAFSDHATDCGLDALQPLERSLVDGLKEIEKAGIVHVEEFPRMFDICWDSAYLRILISTERNARRRVLEGIQSAVEFCKYVFTQDDFAPGNEDAIIRRALDPTFGNPFDLNHIIPAEAGTQFVLRLFNGPQTSPAQLEEVNMEIPLD